MNAAHTAEESKELRGAERPTPPNWGSPEVSHMPNADLTREQVEQARRVRS